MSEKKTRGPLPLTSRPSRRVSFKIGLTEDNVAALGAHSPPVTNGEELDRLAYALLEVRIAGETAEWRKSQEDSKKAAKRQEREELRKRLAELDEELDEPATGGPAPITFADEVKQGGELLKAAYEDRMEEEAAEEIYGESGVA